MTAITGDSRIVPGWPCGFVLFTLESESGEVPMPVKLTAAGLPPPSWLIINGAA